MKKSLVFVFMLMFFVSLSAQAGVITTMPPFTSNDRVLILAPHPDDEAIGTGGVLQQALAVGASVKVVLFTSGENNELAFLVYKKRPVFWPKDILSMGDLRRSESQQAVGVLGLDPKNIISLGYPDFGTMDVFTRFWGQVRRPFRSMLSRQNKVPFAAARSPGAPYVGESILVDLREIIRSYHPTQIFVSHPADTNRDHRALYLFTKIALWDLEGEIVPPKVYPYIVHVVGWPKPRGRHTELSLDVPEELVHSDVDWVSLALTPLQAERKADAISRYVSQIKYAPRYLETFSRRNELFGDYPEVPVISQKAAEPVWQYIGTGDGTKDEIKQGKPDQISSLGYARRANTLLIRLVLKSAIDRDMGVSIFLMGYRKDVPFGLMPKLNLIVGLDGLHIKDQHKNVPLKDVLFIQKERELFFTIPLSMLGSPERILSSAHTSLYDLTLDETAWRVLLIR